MIRLLRRQSLKVVFSLGIWSAMVGLLSAQYYPYQPACPAPYAPYPPYYPYPAYGPYPPALPTAPQVYPKATQPQPTQQPPAQQQPAQPKQPSQPSQSSQPAQPATPPSSQADSAATSAQATDQTSATDGAAAPGSDSSGVFGETATVASVAMQGRGDFMNRFNIFDNMTALPTNRVWGGFQTMDRFQTGFGNYQDPALPLTQKRTEDLYRGGAEIAFCNAFSFIAQGEYVSSVGTNQNDDAWANPWFALKWAAVYTECTVISPILAFQPSTAQMNGELHDKTSRFYPGCLFYQSLGDCVILQGGMQFGIAAGGSGANTVDYGFSLGWWLYRDPSIDAAGRRTDSFDRAALPCCTGILPQLELWGTNVINGAGRQPIDPIALDPMVSYPGFSQGENLYSMTIGCRILFINHISLGLGYAFPISGAYVSKSEFETTFNVVF